MSIYESYNKLNILKNLLQNTFEKKLSNLEKHNKSHFDSISYSIEECNLYAKKCVNYQKYLFENSLNNNNYNNNYDNYNTSNNYFTKSPIKTKRTFSRTKTPIKSNNNTSRLSQSKSNLAIHDKFSRKEKSNNKLNKTIIGKSNTNKNLLTIHNNNVHQRFSVNISNNNIPVFNNNTNNKRINGHRKTLSSITTSLTTNVHSKEKKRNLSKEKLTNINKIKIDSPPKHKLKNNTSISSLNKSNSNNNTSRNNNNNTNNISKISENNNNNNIEIKKSDIINKFINQINDSYLITPITEFDFQSQTYIDSLIFFNNNSNLNINILNGKKTTSDYFAGCLEKIIPFLDSKEIYDLLYINHLINKNLKIVLLNILYKEKNDLKNKINNYMNDNNINNNYINNDLSNFVISKGTKKAIILLNEHLLNRLFYESSSIPNNDILLVYKLFFQFINYTEIINNFNDKKIFWKLTCEYFNIKNNCKTGKIIEDIINEKKINLNFDNLYKIYKLINNKLNIVVPSYFSKICGTTGLFVFFIKDIIDFLGFFEDKKINEKSVFTFNGIIKDIENKINQLKKYLV